MKLLPLAALFLASTCFAAPPALPSLGGATFMPHRPMYFTISDSGHVVFSIAPDGSIRWNGRKVKTDKEFRAAMIAMAKTLQDGACRK